MADTLAAGRAWLEAHGERAVVVPHGDADGLSAGALIAQVARGGVRHVETPWDGSLDGTDGHVIVDWGVRPVASRSPSLYIDHHADPETVDGVVVHADQTGDRSASLLAWRLLDGPDELVWLAAVGAIGDVGESALRQAELATAESPAVLRRLAALSSASGRLCDGPVEIAFDVLAAAATAEAALADPRVRRLQQARETVDRLRRAAMRVPPEVAEAAALIRLDVPAKVHSQVASAWARRLAPRVVVVANAGWRPGRVSFSVRSAEPLDLQAWLRQIYEPPPGTGDYGRAMPERPAARSCRRPLRRSQWPP